MGFWNGFLTLASGMAATVIATACSSSMPGATTPTPAIAPTDPGAPAPLSAARHGASDNEIARVVEGHLYVSRLICPSGASARLASVATLVDAPRGFVDEYLVNCPDGTGATVRFDPEGPAPAPPAGFQLLDDASWAAYRAVDQSVEEAPAGAVTELSRLLARWPGVVPFLHLRATAYFVLEDYPQAVSDFDAVVKRDPNPEYRLERATAIKLKGDPATYLTELVALRKEVKEGWSHYPELICRIGAQRSKDGDPAGLPDVEAGCARKFEPCCEILRERAAPKAVNP